jgi:aminomethyltransferase
VRRHLVGVTTPGRQPPREGSTVLVDGAEVGTVTSGNFSPMLEHGIALALVSAAVDTDPGAALSISLRGRSLDGTIVATPFVHAGQWAGTR